MSSGPTSAAAKLATKEAEPKLGVDAAGGQRLAAIEAKGADALEKDLVLRWWGWDAN